MLNLQISKKTLWACGVLHNRDGILRERHEHACGRNLADCGSIFGGPHKSVGSIEKKVEDRVQIINNVSILKS